METPVNLHFLKPRFLDNPHGWIMHIPFAMHLLEIMRPETFVELGTYSGNAYFAVCEGVKNLGLSTRCHAVDCWEGDIHVGKYSSDVFERVREINQKEFSGFSRLHKMYFDDALPLFKDGSIDLLHIDGTHTYEAVKHDFESWLPKMSQRGVILLHDTQVRKGEFAVYKFYAEIKDQYPSMEFEYSNGLGVMCVGSKTNETVLSLIQQQEHHSYLKPFFHSLGERILMERERDCFRSEVKKMRKKCAQINAELLECKKENKRVGRKNS